MARTKNQSMVPTTIVSTREPQAAPMESGEDDSDADAAHEKIPIAPVMVVRKVIIQAFTIT